MATESHQELEKKIADQEALLAKLQGQDRINEQDVANTLLEIARLKNLKGDEGVHPASAIEIPESTIDQTTPVNTPDHTNVKKQVLSGNKDVTKTVPDNENFQKDT